MRTFIAIDLEAGLKQNLQSIILKVKATGADIRWAQMTGMHLTLKFLGEIETEQASVVKKVLATVSSRHSSFPISLEGTGAFPGAGNPRVLWVGFSDEPRLLALQEDLDRELERKGFPREERAFHPHLTLGRIKGPSRVRNAMLELEKHGRDSLGRMAVRKVAFFESLLRPEGATYRIIEEFDLS